jgi:clan AA aspartic protease
MMTGNVFGRHAFLKVPLRVAQGQLIEIEFVVDTGFVGYLTLPPAAIAALGLPFRQNIPAKLADGSSIKVDTYTAVILWNGEERAVEVIATGDHPLLGTSLLDGCGLDIQFIENGFVIVRSL